MIQDCTDISTLKIFVLLFHWFVFDIEDDKHRGHGDDNPVEGSGDGGEPGVLLDLDEIGEAGEDEAADADQEDKESELLVAVLESVGDSLETWRNKESE